MWPYFITLLIYILSFDGAYFLTQNLTISLIVKLVLVSVSLFVFRRHFRFKMRWDLLAIILGIVIFVQWVLLDKLYPHLGVQIPYNYMMIDIILKLMIGVILAPVVEEFFTRFFLMRWVISKDWEKVKLGKYTLSSFIISVLFFGFSHSRWLVGIISGIILNLLIYNKKNIESCIIAHAVANLALGIYVIATGSFQFW